MDDATSLPPVAVIGLGNMGSPIARRLLDAGFAVTGFDVSAGARERFAGHGGQIAASAAAATEASDVVVLVLPDSAAVRSVVTDPELLGSLRPGVILVDMGSSEPLNTRQLAAEVDEREVVMVDAPVSGGVKGAEAGKLTIMVGGPQAAVSELQPIFGVLGTSVHAGPVGAGHAVKALNNLLSAVHLWVTSEAMVAGASFGLDPEVMLRVFNASSGRSGSTENKWPNFVLTDGYDSGFGLALLLKDMKTATALASQVGTRSELGDVAVELWERAAKGLGPDADHTEVARWLRNQAFSEETRPFAGDL